MSDEKHMDTIAELLRVPGQWGADVLDCIAEVVKESGRNIYPAGDDWWMGFNDQSPERLEAITKTHLAKCEEE